ncbi:MAG: hypothetical protein H0T88_00850 [Lysobacter sp.]|nr:hypothetical protein [Lysobacter sp.]
MRKSYGFRTFKATEIALPCSWQAAGAEAGPQILLTRQKG